jgi:hypothetical protein
MISLIDQIIENTLRDIENDFSSKRAWARCKWVLSGLTAMLISAIVFYWMLFKLIRYFFF